MLSPAVERRWWGLTETAWSYDPLDSNNGGGGGGKSRYELRPAYQSASIVPVEPPLQTEALPQGRAVPDLALNADPNSPWHIYLAGADAYASGTSCVAPAMSGLLAIMYALAPDGTPPKLGYAPGGFNTYLYTLYDTTPKCLQRHHYGHYREFTWQ